MKFASKGFSLIELMIAVAIIAVLASFALSVYQAYVARAQLSEALILAEGLKAPVLLYLSEHASCPSSGLDGFTEASAVNGKYAASVTAGGTAPNCEITAEMKTAGVAPEISGATVSFKIVVVSADIGATSWSCESSADPQYIPTACQ